VRVAAQNGAGLGPWATQTRSPYRLELRVSDMVTLNADANLLTIQWVYDGAGTPAFVIEGGVDATGITGSLPVGTVTLFRVAVKPGRYVARVRLADDVALENPSNAVSVTATTTLEAPATPTSLQVNVEGTRVTLAWRPNYTAGPPTETFLLVTGFGPILLGPGRSAEFTDVPFGTYEVRIAARNAVGQSEPSAPVTFVVPGGCALPASPSWVSVGVEGGGVALVTWEPAESGGAPSDYLVLVDGLGSNTVTFRTGTARRIGGAVPSGEYRIRVQAENACGLSTPSAVQVLRVP